MEIQQDGWFVMYEAPNTKLIYIFKISFGVILLWGQRPQPGEKRGQKACDMVFLGVVSRPYDWRPWLTLLETDMISSM